MNGHSAKWTESVKSLAERFARIPQIAKLSDGAHNEPLVLSHSLTDLAEASRSYLEAWPALLDRELFTPLRKEWDRERSRKSK
jgi:hypothetical protein